MKTYLLVPTLLFLTITQSCKNKDTVEQDTEKFPTTTITQLDTFTTVDYVSEIHAIQNVEIRARVNGYLDKIHVDEGATVTKGQLLFSINNKEYVEELAKAKALYRSAIAEVNAAELEYKNVTQLSDKKIVSSTELSLAKSKLEAQKAKMEEAQAHQSYVEIKLSNSEIRAPFNGTINRIPHKIGSLISEGTLLTSIADNESVYAYFDLSEKEYLTYARNLKNDSANSKIVSLILADGSTHEYKGLIETMEGAIDGNTGNIAFRAKFPNPHSLIKHGASGKVRLNKRYENVCIVPQKSTFEIQDRMYVYVVNKENKAVMRKIECQARLPHFFILKNGLSVGETIVLDGVQNVKENMVIQPQITGKNNLKKDLAIKK
jgi:membrane fusion protein (multidrug efflux system)